MEKFHICKSEENILPIQNPPLRCRIEETHRGKENRPYELSKEGFPGFPRFQADIDFMHECRGEDIPMRIPVEFIYVNQS